MYMAEFLTLPFIHKETDKTKKIKEIVINESKKSGIA